MIRLTTFKPQHHQSTTELVEAIRREYHLPPPRPSYNPPLPDNYWVALHNNQVVGTVGLNVLSGYGVLKRMFVATEYRGNEKKVALHLLEKALDTCKEEKLSKLYLGTIDAFVAAHRFYEKNGFQKMSKHLLPADFPNNPVDNVFYFKTL